MPYIIQGSFAFNGVITTLYNIVVVVISISCIVGWKSCAAAAVLILSKHVWFWVCVALQWVLNRSQTICCVFRVLKLVMVSITASAKYVGIDAA